MIPEQLSVRKRIIFSAISEGMTNSISLKNATPGKKPSTISVALNSLIERGFLIESCFTYRDPESHKPRGLTFYRLTEKAINKYFPLFAPYMPSMKAWTELYPCLTKLPRSSATNPGRKERTLRVLETEMFCSSAGILTTLDKRTAIAPSVFGSRNFPSVPIWDSLGKESDFDLSFLDEESNYEGKISFCEAGQDFCKANQSSCEANVGSGNITDEESKYYHNYLCEAVKKGNNDEAWTEIINKSLCPSDPYSFYRSKEIITAFKSESISGEKNLAVIRSQYVGAVVNRNQGFVIYRVPKYNGLNWIEKTENKVKMAVSRFCDVYIPQGMISLSNPVSSAIFFYQSNRELLNILMDIKENKLKNFGIPYKKIYAIPFSIEGLRTFQHILSSESFDQDCIKSVCKNDPSFEQYENSNIFDLTYFGSIRCFSAFPMEIRKLVRLLTEEDGYNYSIVGYSWQQDVFAKLLPDVAFLNVDI